MQMKPISLITAIAWLAASPVFANGLTDASLTGSIQCSLTGANFPAAVGEPMALTYTGSMTLVADGAGKFVSGHMTTRGAGDMAGVRNARPCKFNLISGTYRLNPDGTGQTVTSWAYWEGGGNTFSDQVCCDNLFHPQHFQGLDLNNLRKDRARTLEALVVPNSPQGMI